MDSQTNILTKKELYDKEQDHVLKFMLNQRFFDTWRNTNIDAVNLNEDEKFENTYNPIKDYFVELFITPTCNQSCQYCYLIKHADKLYPQEINDHEQIKKNLRILLQWFVDNNLHPLEIDCFSGEIWHSNFGLEILDILYEYIFSKGLGTAKIMIPSNCSFLLNPKQTALIQRRIDKFLELNCRLCFSISVDGQPIEDFSRPLNSKQEKNDRFYDDMFIFARHNDYCFHPMVSAQNVKYWIENYEWWMSKLNQYNINAEGRVMMLEVRNDNWTDEAINDYLKFLNYLIDRDIRLRKGNIESFAYNCVCEINYKQPFRETGYIPWIIGIADSFPGCTVSHGFTIRLGDLMICPCHRTSYDKYNYGQFIVENDQIVDIKANNPYMAERILYMDNQLCSVRCDACPIALMCLKGCFGSQLEANQDPFIPIDSVCKLFIEKYKFLFKKYHELGLFDIWEKITPYESSYIMARKFLAQRDKMEEAYELGIC